MKQRKVKAMPCGQAQCKTGGNSLLDWNSRRYQPASPQSCPQPLCTSLLMRRNILASCTTAVDQPSQRSTTTSTTPAEPSAGWHVDRLRTRLVQDGGFLKAATPCTSLNPNLSSTMQHLSALSLLAFFTTTPKQTLPLPKTRHFPVPAQPAYS